MLRAAPYLLHQSYHQELHWCSRGRAAKGQVGWQWLDFDPWLPREPLSDWGAGAAEGVGGWGQEGSGTNSQACTWHQQP